MLYGITHDATTKVPMVRIPRVFKVGIGVAAKGPDIHVFINPADRQWTIRWKKKGEKDYRFDYYGVAGVVDDKEKDKAKAAEFAESRAKARAAYIALVPQCEARRYPDKLPYFTFLKLGADNTYHPAWEAIEANGPTPTEIDVVFNDNTPFSASYQRWGNNKLKCSGDGINAARSVDFPETEERTAAAEAKAQNRRTFPIVDGCYTRGCSYAKPGQSGRSECMPHANLQFHLVRAPRLGAISRFDTTSIRSITNLFACLDSILRFTGQGDPAKGIVAGIPLKLVLRPFHVVVNGKASKAYAVQLEFRAETIQALREKLYAAASKWHTAIALPEKPAASAAAEVPAIAPMEEVSEGTMAALMSAEFSDGEPGSGSATIAEVATSRVDELAQKIGAVAGGGESETIRALKAGQAEVSDANEDVDFVEATTEEAAGLFESDGEEAAAAESGEPAATRSRRRPAR